MKLGEKMTLKSMPRFIDTGGGITVKKSVKNPFLQ